MSDIKTLSNTFQNIGRDRAEEPGCRQNLKLKPTFRSPYAILLISDLICLDQQRAKPQRIFIFYNFILSRKINLLDNFIFQNDNNLNRKVFLNRNQILKMIHNSLFLKSYQIFC